MKRIGFSHYYSKLWGQTKAQLLQCVKVMRCEIPEEAVFYDTRYVILPKGHGYYTLEDGNYLRLLLMGNKDIPFTTYRKDTEENRKKYLGAVGDWFEIYVKETDK